MEYSQEALQELRSWAAASRFVEHVEPLADITLARVAEGEHIQTINLAKELEALDDHPRRPKGNVVLRTELSFVDYVNDHKDDEATVIFAEDKQVVAVFNHHKRHTHGAVVAAGAEAGWNDFRATLELKYTPSWTAWTQLATSGYMTQADFADFLEVNDQDILSPAAGEVLEMVTNLRLASESTVEARTHLGTGGTHIRYSENFVPMGGDGDQLGVIQFPHHLELSLQVFDGGKEFIIPALLRYAVQNGQVKFRLAFTNYLATMFDQAFDELVQGITEKTGIPVLRGHLA